MDIFKDKHSASRIDSSLQSGHRSWITSMVFSPHEDVVASAARDQTIIFWDAKNHTQKSVLPDAGYLVSFSPDGKTLAAIHFLESNDYDNKHRLRLWDFPSLKERASVIIPYGNTVSGICFKPDGKKILVYRANICMVIDLRTHVVEQSFPFTLEAAAFTPDGLFLAIDYTQISLWELDRQKKVSGFYHNRNSITAAAFSPVSNLVSIGDGRGEVAIWDYAKGVLTRSFTRPADKFGNLAFDQDGKRLFCFSIQEPESNSYRQRQPTDVLLTVFDLDAGDVIFEKPSGRIINEFSFPSPNFIPMATDLNRTTIAVPDLASVNLLDTETFDKRAVLTGDYAKLLSTTLQHEKNYHELVFSRRVTRAEEFSERLPDVDEIIGGMEEKREGTFALIYGYEKETLSIYVIDKHRLRGIHNRSIGIGQIDAQIANYRNALYAKLRSSTERWARSPHTRHLQLISPDSPSVDFEAAAQELTTLLLPEEIAEIIKDASHLIVVPIRGLGTVPFADLSPFGSDEKLINRMTVTIAPNLGVLIRSASDSPLKVKKPLIVGNPEVLPYVGYILPALPGAEREAREVARLFGSEALTGRFATRESVISRMRDADLLYFATHGIANENQPLTGSFLALSESERSSGRLNAIEIQNLKLKADLCVLSACQTGLGKTNDAGIIGLARAFQLAGVRQVVMSLWNIDDETTVSLMINFSKQLKHHSVADALRNAQISESQNNPAHLSWASFALFGM